MSNDSPLSLASSLGSNGVNYKKIRTWAPLALYIFNLVPFMNVMSAVTSPAGAGLLIAPIIIWAMILMAALPFAIAPLYVKEMSVSTSMGVITYLILAIPTLLVLFL